VPSRSGVGISGLWTRIKLRFPSSLQRDGARA